MKSRFFRLPMACLLFAAACGADLAEDGSSEPADSAPIAAQVTPHGHAAGAASPAVGQGALAPADAIAWTTDEFEVAPGKERYLCFAKTVDEDVVVGGYSTEGQPFVHHLIFSKTRSPQKVGFEDCPEAFRSSWDPVFITGAGAAKLDFPTDAGHKYVKGTQLIVQMHLLNTSEEPVKGRVNINLHRSAAKNPRPVMSYYFGSAAVKLPPKQTSQVTGNCKVGQGAEIIAAFPHMHMLGTSMTFEVGRSEDTMKTVFKRDPFSFDNQTIEPLKLTLQPGDITRVTCKYNNTLNQEVGYGESTNNEMCYLIAFALDRGGACLAALPPLGTLIDIFLGKK
jgi:hypothetical protein